MKLSDLRPYVTYRDRRHWSLDVGRFGIYRWCPGAPCTLPGARRDRHGVVTTWQGRP